MGYCLAIRNKVLMYATMWMKFEYINYEKTKHKSHISHDTIYSKYKEDRRIVCFSPGVGGEMKMFRDSLMMVVQL